MSFDWGRLTVFEKTQFWSNIDYVVVDCDTQAIEGAVDTINKLKSMGKNIFYLTNNSNLTPRELSQKCLSLGYNAEEKEAISSVSLTVAYLKSINFNKKAYVIGSQALIESLDEAGIEAFGHGPDIMEAQNPTMQSVLQQNYEFVLESRNVGAVIVGYDFHFSYNKINKASQFLSDPKCLFIATNMEERWPYRRGNAPDTGSFASAIIACSKRQPILIGKPSTVAFDLVLKNKGVKAERALMIGDRLETDVKFGNASGMKTLLVMTGYTSMEMLSHEAETGDITLMPTYYANSLKDLV